MAAPKRGDVNDSIVRQNARLFRQILQVLFDEIELAQKKMMFKN
jgi:hypothetical protein